MNSSDAIVALATPPGEGGVAIIRLSGSGCLGLVRPLFRFSRTPVSIESHRFYHGFIHDQHDHILDEVMLVYMQGPRSFTAEDVVEVHCHGGYQTVSKLLDLFVSAGIRLALPGEFSYRAFLNGRIDLPRAEAIVDLIHARSAKAHALALDQMTGQLSNVLYEHTDRLRQVLVLLEAWIDFPDEELPKEDLLSVEQQIRQSVDQLNQVISTYNTGRLYREGATLLLLGKPNVGKSSLLNSLLGEERAIVTDIAGTTRDLLEEGLVVNGIPIRLIDSAGMRKSDDPIEMIGIERTRQRVASADLVLALFDGTRPFDDEDRAAWESCRDRAHLVILTKADLDSGCQLPIDLHEQGIRVSSKTGLGLDTLRAQIFQRLSGGVLSEDNSVMLSNQRHRAAAISAVESLDRLLQGLAADLPLDLLSADLRDALHFLGDITGETTTDDVLGAIFCRFCIGK